MKTDDFKDPVADKYFLIVCYLPQRAPGEGLVVKASSASRAVLSTLNVGFCEKTEVEIFSIALPDDWLKSLINARIEPAEIKLILENYQTKLVWEGRAGLKAPDI